ARTRAERNELDRAAGKTELAAEQAGSLLGRAARLAAEKEKQATDARAAAAEKEKQAAALRAKAEQLPPGTPEKSAANAQASLLQAEADDLRAAAAKADEEAAALRKGIEAAGGDAPAQGVRRAAGGVPNNRQAEAAGLQRSGAGRVGRLAGALAEEQPEGGPDLIKTLQKAADELNELGAAQDELRKRAE